MWLKQVCIAVFQIAILLLFLCNDRTKSTKLQCNELYPMYINSRVDLCLKMNQINFKERVRGK
jgi:hypothetical protein